MITRKTLSFLLVLGLSCGWLCAAEPDSPHATPQREGRGFWNHSGTGAYPGDWQRTAKELGEAGFTMILPNMCWGGVAHYPSDVLPRSATHERLGDQIDQCVKAAHRHGLEVHVWKVAWNLGHAAPKEFVERMRRENRTQVSSSGKTRDWLCPSHPDNFKLELAAMVEIARKYPVDGLHFDYIRYPGSDWCFCEGCRRRFEVDSGRPVADWPNDCRRGDRRDEYNEWRCQRITRLVEAVGRGAKCARPGLKISAAVFGSYPDCKRSIAQDWVAWAKNGLVDFLCPMNYTNDDKVFHRLVEKQVGLVEGRVRLFPGIGATSSHSTLSADRVLGQIRIARSLGADGFTIFNLSPETAAAIVPALPLTRQP